VGISSFESKEITLQTTFSFCSKENCSKYSVVTVETYYMNIHHKFKKTSSVSNNEIACNLQEDSLKNRTNNSLQMSHRFILLSDYQALAPK